MIEQSPDSARGKRAVWSYDLVEDRTHDGYHSCSLRTLGAIAYGNGEHLVYRATDVILKERRRLVLVAREMPLSPIHLEDMLTLASMGVTILPPVPAFYNHPQNIDDIVDHIIARVLDQFGIEAKIAKRWDGRMQGPKRV